VIAGRTVVTIVAYSVVERRIFAACLGRAGIRRTRIAIVARELIAGAASSAGAPGVDGAFVLVVALLIVHERAVEQAFAGDGVAGVGGAFVFVIADYVLETAITVQGIATVRGARDAVVAFRGGRAGNQTPIARFHGARVLVCLAGSFLHVGEMPAAVEVSFVVFRVAQVSGAGVVVEAVIGVLEVDTTGSRVAGVISAGKFVLTVQRDTLASAHAANVILGAGISVVAGSGVVGRFAALDEVAQRIDTRVLVDAEIVVRRVHAARFGHAGVFGAGDFVVATDDCQVRGRVHRADRQIGFQVAEQSAVAQVAVFEGLAVRVFSAQAVLHYQIFQGQQFSGTVTLAAQVSAGARVAVVTLCFVVGELARQVHTDVVGTVVAVVALRIPFSARTVRVRKAAVFARAQFVAFRLAHRGALVVIDDALVSFVALAARLATVVSALLVRTVLAAALLFAAVFTIVAAQALAIFEGAAALTVGAGLVLDALAAVQATPPVPAFLGLAVAEAAGFLKAYVLGTATRSRTLLVVAFAGAFQQFARAEFAAVAFDNAAAAVVQIAALAREEVADCRLASVPLDVLRVGCDFRRLGRVGDLCDLRHFRQPGLMGNVGGIPLFLLLEPVFRCRRIRRGPGGWLGQAGSQCDD